MLIERLELGSREKIPFLFPYQNERDCKGKPRIAVEFPDNVSVAAVGV